MLGMVRAMSSFTRSCSSAASSTLRGENKSGGQTADAAV